MGPATVKPVDFAEEASTRSGETDIYEPISWEELAEDFRNRGMPEGVVPMRIMLKKVIASNGLGKVGDDIIQLTGEPQQNLTWIVRRALA